MSVTEEMRERQRDEAIAACVEMHALIYAWILSLDERGIYPGETLERLKRVIEALPSWVPIDDSVRNMDWQNPPSDPLVARVLARIVAIEARLDALEAS